MPPRAPRCTFKENGRRCTRDGHGNPPLCAPHRAAVVQAAQPRSPAQVIADAMVNFLQGKPVNRDATLGAVEEFASQWAGLGGDYRPDMFGGDREDHVHRRAQAGQGATPWWADAAARAANARAGQAPQPDPRAAERIAARQAMGFSPSDVLSEDVIKTRQKKLARKHHPDMGGSVDRMAAINAAADVLIASLYD